MLLRGRRIWYDALNDYRNVLYHRGWKGEAGAYFPVGAPEPEATDADRNLLLVPDLESIEKDARAHQWTYRDGLHLETVVKVSLDGTRDLLDAVCLGVWGGRPVHAGTMPPEEHPTILVGCPRPAPFRGRGKVLLPVFTSEQAAHEFPGYPSRGNLALASLPLFTTHFPGPAFGICIAGLEGPVMSGDELWVVVDPTNASLTDARFIGPVLRESLSKTPFMDPIGLPRDGVNAERLLCWVQR
jgi:hypothetical protein